MTTNITEFFYTGAQIHYEVKNVIYWHQRDYLAFIMVSVQWRIQEFCSGGFNQFS
jgi:hypothetical protein